MPEKLRNSEEINPDPKLAAAGKFLPACSPEATAMYTAIWTELQK